MLPLSTECSPPSTRSRVLFPQPLGPSIRTARPAATSRLRCSAHKRPSPDHTRGQCVAQIWFCRTSRLVRSELACIHNG